MAFDVLPVATFSFGLLVCLPFCLFIYLSFCLWKDLTSICTGDWPLVDAHHGWARPRFPPLLPHLLDPRQQQANRKFAKKKKQGEIKLIRLFCGFVNSKPEGRKTAIGSTDKLNCVQGILTKNALKLFLKKKKYNKFELLKCFQHQSMWQ